MMRMRFFYFPSMKIALIIIAFFSMAFGAVSDKCIEEIAELPNAKKDFNFKKFPKELGISVVKVQASCKTKFTCPKDDKITDVGLTAGCVKQLPNNPNELLVLLKEVGIEMGRNIIASKLEVEKEMIPRTMDELPDFAIRLSIKKTSEHLGVALEEIPTDLKELEAFIKANMKDKSAENILSVLSFINGLTTLETDGSGEEEEPTEENEEKDGERVRFGVELAYNSRHYDYGNNKISFGHSIELGIVLSIPLTKNSSFHLGSSFIYSIPRSYEYEFDDTRVHEEVNEYNLSFPLLFRYKLFSGILYVEVGTRADILLSYERKINGVADTHYQKNLVGGSVVDVGFSLGCGWNINKNVSLSIKGLTSTNFYQKEEPQVGDYPSDHAHRAIRFGVTYMF